MNYCDELRSLSDNIVLVRGELWHYKRSHPKDSTIERITERLSKLEKQREILIELMELTESERGQS